MQTLINFNEKTGEIRLNSSENQEVKISIKEIAEVFTVSTKEVETALLELNHESSDSISVEELIQIIPKIKSEKTTLAYNWLATSISNYLCNGFIVRDDKKDEIKDGEMHQVITAFSKDIDTVFEGKEKEVLALIDDYASTWNIFHEYDLNNVTTNSDEKNVIHDLAYDESVQVISNFRTKLQSMNIASDFFAQEVGDKLKSIIGALNQTYDGHYLYPSVEKRAANLLYFIIKDHPFVDGNKRVAAMLFLYFLERNSYSWKVSKERKINDNALSALTLLIANSRPEEKDMMINIMVRLLQNDRVGRM